MESTYEPFSNFFLLPASLKSRITPLSKLLKDKEFFKGNFNLRKPNNFHEFKTELKKMKICSKMQQEFILKIHLKKRLKQIQADQEINSIKFQKSGRGRPMKKKNFNKKFMKKISEFSKEINEHDDKFYREKVNNDDLLFLHDKKISPKSSFSEKDDIEFDIGKFLKYKRKKLKIEEDPETSKIDNGIQVSTKEFEFFEESNKRMKDVSTTNVCEMIDFGNELPSICSSNDLFNSFGLKGSRSSSLGDMEKFITNDVCVQTTKNIEGESKFTQVDFF